MAIDAPPHGGYLSRLEIEMSIDRCDNDAVLVAIHEKTALVRVVGRGTFKNGSTLKQFGLAAMREGCDCFILDMDACIGMDSTFMGVLAGIALRLKRESRGMVVMMNLSQKTHSLLSTLGLHQLLELHEKGTLDGALREHLKEIADLSLLDNSGDSDRVTLETMLEAHQNLVNVAPENLPKFKSVIEYVSQDLKRLG